MLVTDIGDEFNSSGIGFSKIVLTESYQDYVVTNITVTGSSHQIDYYNVI